MSNLKKLVASPSALFTFEAAARLGGFKLAANELGVTQAAVSFAIKTLEQNLGVQLFRREHKHVKLSDAGDKFYADVSMGLGHIGRSAEELRSMSLDQLVTLSCSTAFAGHWVIPRLPSFRVEHPGIDFRIQTSDKDIDIMHSKIERGIRRGNGRWPEYESELFAPEELIPVCSPTFLIDNGPIDTVEELALRKLIHLEEPFRPRPNWSDWFKHFQSNVKISTERLRLNDYALVVQAAIGGQGIALGWSHILEYPMHHGLLVTAYQEKWRTDQNFYIVSPRNSTLSKNGQIIRDWILREAISS